MAEKVAKLGIYRDKDYLLYVKDSAVWRIRRKQPGMPNGRPEKVASGGFKMDDDYIYFVDKDGDVSRAKRVAGATKSRPSARSPSATSPSAKSRSARLNEPRVFDSKKGPAKITKYERTADPEQTALLVEKAGSGHHRILVALSVRLRALGWTDVQEIAHGLDLWATAPNGTRVIFEAKTITAVSEGSQVRSAVGQLLEYRYSRGKPADFLALVTDRPVRENRVAFLRTLKISSMSVKAGVFSCDEPVLPILKSV